MPDKVKVAVNGYGVIGERVADAVALQDDMELVGIADIATDYRIRVAVERGYNVYASVPDKVQDMKSAKIPVMGTLTDLLKNVDIVVDATPKGIGAKNKRIYDETNKKAIFQGGEKHEVAGLSFTAQVNFADAVNKRYARVVSCNTTGINRVMNAMHKRGWIKRARAVLMRRATDPWEANKTGIINTAIPEMRVPSHQGPDAQTVMKGLDITTMAGAGPYDLSHLHFAMVETTKPISVEELRKAIWEEPRIAFVHAADGLVALNSVIELMRNLRRPRHDMWEVAVWEDALASDGRELYLTYQVDNEAITIPESVDAIRALTGLETDGMKSINKTNKALGVVKTFLPKTIHEEEFHPIGKSFREYMEAGYMGSEEPTENEPSPDQVRKK